jgi:haloacetate dehalogenase
MVMVMERLGFLRFSVVGHDRGGRVAYRMALDHSDRIERIAVLDILPTETSWNRSDDRFALAFCRGRSWRSRNRFRKGS